jgi:hypothetical protein
MDNHRTDPVMVGSISGNKLELYSHEGIVISRSIVETSEMVTALR